MRTLPDIVRELWGRRAPEVTDEYQSAARYQLFMRDVALFCNAAAPIQGVTEFDRGVEEGKRRVWLHIARMSKLNADDFIKIADGETR